MRDAFDRGMRAMCSAEGVIDIQLSERRELLGEHGIVFFLLGMKAKIFKQRQAIRRVRRFDRRSLTVRQRSLLKM